MFECAVALLLLMDVSGSVSSGNFILQRNGTAEAFRTEEVQEAITQQGSVAISIVQWSNTQTITVPWVVIRSKEDAKNLANVIEGTERSGYIGAGTDMAFALSFGISHMGDVPCAAKKKVIDVSGDGVNDTGEGHLRDTVSRAEEEDITVNGLPIEDADKNIVPYYRKNVRTSNGFTVEALSSRDFPRSIRKKLVMEIGSLDIKYQ